MPEISDEIKKFIFDYIDSVEQLEILLLLCSNRQKHWSVQEISDYIRSSIGSVDARLKSLCNSKLLLRLEGNPVTFQAKSFDENEKIITELQEIYKIRKHSVLELIFSSLKKARAFANAFKVGGKPENNEDNHG